MYSEIPSPLLLSLLSQKFGPVAQSFIHWKKVTSLCGNVLVLVAIAARHGCHAQAAAQKSIEAAILSVSAAHFPAPLEASLGEA
mmetsp:Transcript_3715/g.6560  ORF Transcript_3715/g.6560 Transcript_3715/m.6560 type:complete len:84 (+) Transcript_3715:1135-1386(+)